MPVQSSEDRVEHDPQLKERGMYSELTHPLLGRRKFQNAPFKFSSSEMPLKSAAPLLGQLTRQVMEELLGFSHQEVLEGYDDGTFWPPETPMYPYIEEALR